MALSRLFLRGGTKFLKHPLLVGTLSFCTSSINRSFTRQAQDLATKMGNFKVGVFNTLGSLGIISGFVAGSAIGSMYLKNELAEIPHYDNLNKIIVLTALCAEKDEGGKDSTAKAIADLEAAVQELNEKTLTAVNDAIKSIDATQCIVCSYIKKGYCAIEQDPVHLCDYEKVWCELHQISVERCKAMRGTMRKRIIAEGCMRRLQDLIKKAKCCPTTQKSYSLRLAYDTLECVSNKLGASVQKLECVKSDSCLIPAFNPILIDFKNQLKDEKKQGRSKCGCDDGRKSELCCGEMIDEAYKKVLSYHKDVMYIAAVKNAL